MSNSSMSIAEVVARSYLNRKEVENSEKCGCFGCLSIFLPSDIALWSDSEDPRDDDPGSLRSDSERFRGNTAICPNCESDSVIGSASGYEISEPSLRVLQAHWFRSKSAKK